VKQSFVQAIKLRRACDELRHGGVIAYPTEAVYGLGCDPLRPEAVARLLAIKGRHWSKGLILIADRPQRLQPFVAIDLDPLPGVLQQTWPGPHTWILPASRACPRWIKGRHSGVAVRVTDHPLAAALCRELASPLVSTSANRSGQRPADRALNLRLRFAGELDYLLAGKLGGLPRPTSIQEFASGRVLR
jgi:L-threonylcarbamoyladenylate synthase